MPSDSSERGGATARTQVLPSAVSRPFGQGAFETFRASASGRLSMWRGRLSKAGGMAWKTTAAAVRRQTEFNQIARFVLAVPLVVGAPSYVAYDAAPPAPLTATSPTSEPTGGGQAAPEDGKVRPPPIAPPAGEPYRVNAQAAPVQAAADSVPGPRVRAICSRGGRTVFLDDRAEVNASSDWREEVSLNHPGAVCAFTTRFGVADPQFRPIETRISGGDGSTSPVPVKTIAITPAMLAPPEVAAGAFAPVGGGVHLDAGTADSDPGDVAQARSQIDQALAALGAPTVPAVGSRIPTTRAEAAKIPLPEPRPMTEDPAQGRERSDGQISGQDSRDLAVGHQREYVVVALGGLDLDPLSKDLLDYSTASEAGTGVVALPYWRFSASTSPYAGPAGRARSGRFGDAIFVTPWIVRSWTAEVARGDMTWIQDADGASFIPGTVNFRNPKDLAWRPRLPTGVEILKSQAVSEEAIAGEWMATHVP